MGLEGTPKPPGQSLPPGPEVCTPCQPLSCEAVFDRVIISYLIRGGTKIMWELLDTFKDPRPFEFQLQVGETNSNDSDDWKDVGLPVMDTFVAVDDEQRTYSKWPNTTHYRLQLTTPVARYLSDPIAGEGTLSVRDWRLARNIIREERTRLKFHAGQRGVLLKRRITGEDCPVCLDHQTREIRDPDCPECYGTGKNCGYYFPIDCVYADMDPKAYHVELDGGRVAGTTSNIRVRTRMINTWLMSEEDVWLNLESDDRYFVHEVQNVAEWRGVPLVAKVALRPIPYTHVVYDIPIPEQLARLEGL
jgi:hypothetical protein